MTLLIILFFAVFGALIGSFLNVMILRLNTGMGVGGRSSCFSCGKRLDFHELVPVLSSLFQQGKCLVCKSKISWQYPIVEALTAAVFALVAWKELSPFYGLYDITVITNLVLVLTFLSLLIVVVVYDFKHKIIPDGFAFLLGAVALVRVIFLYGTQTFDIFYLADLLAGPIIALPFFLFWLLSKGKWMGLGDAKLALGIGWFLGLAGAVSAVCLSFWVGAAVALILLFVHKYIRRKSGITMKSEIPFAPFLAIGLFAVYLHHLDLFQIDFFLFFLN